MLCNELGLLVNFMLLNKPISLFIFVICFFPAFAQEEKPNLQQAIVEAESQVLFENKVWLRLLHINSASKRSDIISPDFFYSYNKKDKTTSRITARNELIATIRAFFIPLKEGGRIIHMLYAALQHATIGSKRKYSYLRNYLKKRTVATLITGQSLRA